jgi:hypothetical protein
MSFPPGTEMFQFPGFALNPYGFRVQSPHGPRSPSPRSPLDSRYGVEGGLPHSEIPGSKLVRSSPRLIAAYHVLHRLSAPRHPPNALKTLDRSHDRCPPLGSDAHRVQKDLSLDLSKDVFACQMDPAYTAHGPLLAAGLIFLPAGSIPSLRFQSRSDAQRPIHSLTSRMPQGQLGRAQKRNEGSVSPVATPSQGGAA